MNTNTFHKDFKLNGQSFTSAAALCDFSKTISEEALVFLQDWFSSADEVHVQTSGSTGKPKQIKLKKIAMVNSAKATGEFFNLQEKTTALLSMSPSYIAGKMMLVRALVLGWDLDIIAPSKAPLKGLLKNYDFGAMVPLQLANSLQDLAKIKTLIVGGGAVSEPLLEKIQGLETAVFATYGMTETITHIAVKKLNSGFTSKQGLEVYKVLPNIQISTDARGCLCITAPRIAKEPIVTNDIVQLVSDTEFEWLGRLDMVINSGGVKLHPERIEKKLAKVIGSRFFISSIADADLGEKLVLIVEGVSTSLNFPNSLDLDAYEKPKAIYFIEKFVETPTQKIDRLKTMQLL